MTWWAWWLTAQLPLAAAWHHTVRNRKHQETPMAHPYTRDPHSGAGNCVCGWAETSSVHPHAYTQAYRDNLCVCAHPAGHELHTDADTARPNPVYPERKSSLRGTVAARESVRQARGVEAELPAPVTFARSDGGAR